MVNTMYLITGANKGIGREITRQLLLRPTTTVVATVRNPADPTAASLPALPTGPDSTLVLVQLAEPADYAALAPTLAARGITTIDVAVANAGAATGFHTVLTTTPDDAAADMAVNAAAPLRLFQTVWPLLRPASGGGGKMVFMSSSLGSIAGLDEESLTGVGYGMGKAALNFLAKKIAVDLKGEGVVVGILHPGWVKTGMGQALADSLGVKEPVMSVEDSAKGCLERIAEFTAETSGKFVHVSGKTLAF